MTWSAVTLRARILAVVCLCVSPCPAAAAETFLLEIRQASGKMDERSHEPIVEVVLSDESARIVADVTTRNVGAQAEIRVDGEALLKSVIREPILGGKIMISGRFSRQAVDDMAARLMSGAAKVEFVVNSAN